MSYSTLPPPTDLLGVNAALHSHRYSIGERRREIDRQSPTMTKPTSPLFRTSFPAELPPHLSSLYSSPYAAAALAAAVAGQVNGSLVPPNFSTYGRGPGPASFYTGIGAHDGWRRSPYMSQLDLCWQQNFRSLDAIVGPRTKAPREATTILKSWLNEHKDNPYPTKSEKMTLSIVTHMTLTQVSTWFANARRRIKKENKMTWIPKTRCGEREDNSGNEEEIEKENCKGHSSHIATTRDVFGIGGRRTSGDQDARREYHLSDAASSSSRSFSPESSSYKSPNMNMNSHPMFSSFHRMNPQLYAAAAASLLNGSSSARRHAFSRMPSDQFSENGFPPDWETTSPSRRDSSELPNDGKKIEKMESGEKPLKSPHTLLRLPVLENQPHGPKARYGTSAAVPHNEGSHSRPSESLSPFVRLPISTSSFQKDSPIDEEKSSQHRPSKISPTVQSLDQDRQTARKFDEEDSSPKQEASDVSLPFPRTRTDSDDVVHHKKPFPGFEDVRKSEDESVTHGVQDDNLHFEKQANRESPTSQDDDQQVQSSFPTLYNPSIFPGGSDQLRTSPTNGNQDALTSWIRDFQQLVASGQELKAKKALATALAVAAKAGAYSRHGARMNTPYYHPEHSRHPASDDRRKSAGSSEDGLRLTNRHSPGVSPSNKSAFRFLPNDRNPTHDGQFGNISFDTSLRDQQSSPDTSPTHDRQRPTYKVSRMSYDNTPINLTKSSSPEIGHWRRTSSKDDHASVEV